MHYIIFHYHLLPGGVTDVVVLSARAVLQNASDITSLTLVSGRTENCDSVLERISRGLPEKIQSMLKVEIVPELDYADESVHINENELLNKLLKKFGGKDVLWWIHNYQLGKSTAFTSVFIKAAAEFKQKTLFHIHDFPECSRYSNLQRLRNARLDLYPQGETVRYAVINSRDYDYLLKAGIKEENLFLLQNPVSASNPFTVDSDELKKGLFHRFGSDFPGSTPDAPLLFYPVRTIRRKNIMEAGLFSRLLPEGANLLVTLPGISDQEIRYSRLVERAFKEGMIPGYWGIGTYPDEGLLSFRNYQMGCDAVFSSSVQEGFGYLFINSLKWRKPLISRALDIMGGFKGLFKKESSLFYENLYIPVTGEDKSALKEKYLDKAERLVKEVPSVDIDGLRSSIRTLFQNEVVDFSFLAPEQQYEFLKRIKKDKSLLMECRSLNTATIKKASSVLCTSPGDEAEPIEALFGFREYNRQIDEIIDSFQKGSVTSASGRSDTLVNIFSQPVYLRLLYDY